MGRYTTELIQYNRHFYLFDSHSRDERGLSVEKGTSVLLKFESILEIEQYVQVASYSDLEQSYFQL